MANDDVTARGTSDQCEQLVERHVELDVTVDELWTALTDESVLAGWLGDEVHLDVRPGATGYVVDTDGTRREVIVTSVDEGRGISWLWWNERDGVSTVQFSIDPGAEPGSSRLRVVEAVRSDRPTVTACTRRWERATTALWRRVSAAAVR